jgi:hypothetical protein
VLIRRIQRRIQYDENANKRDQGHG